MVGSAGVTMSWTVAVAVVLLTVSVGAKVTVNVSVPAAGMLPAAGV